jgi:hypothetical protein
VAVIGVAQQLVVGLCRRLVRGARHGWPRFLLGRQHTGFLRVTGTRRRSARDALATATTATRATLNIIAARRPLPARRRPVTCGAAFVAAFARGPLTLYACIHVQIKFFIPVVI